MKISVVTIVYNDCGNIERTLLSVLQQSAFESIEYIVIDGASTDGTSEIISNYRDKIDKYVCEPDKGIYNAMNKGLRLATGDYVIFMNSGDTFSSSDVIKELIDIITHERHLPDIVYGNYREVCDNNLGKAIPARDADKIWYGPVAAHQSTLYRIGHLRCNDLMYDESYKIAADYKLTLSAITASKKTLRTDVCISNFDITGASNKNQNMGLKEANRARREVLGWNRLQTGALTTLLLCARYSKKYMRPLYNLIRYK